MHRQSFPMHPHSVTTRPLAFAATEEPKLDAARLEMLHDRFNCGEHHRVFEDALAPLALLPGQLSYRSNEDMWHHSAELGIAAGDRLAAAPEVAFFVSQYDQLRMAPAEQMKQSQMLLDAVAPARFAEVVRVEPVMDKQRGSAGTASRYKFKVVLRTWLDAAVVAEMLHHRVLLDARGAWYVAAEGVGALEAALRPFHAMHHVKRQRVVLGLPTRPLVFEVVGVKKMNESVLGAHF